MTRTPRDVSAVPGAGGPAVPHQAAYLAALRTGNRRSVFAVVERARTAGLDVAALYVDVVQPSLREIGRLWQAGEVTVAEEHLATAITQLVMAQVYTADAASVDAASVDAASAGDDTRCAVAACVDAEHHDIGLRMICDLLERDGWDTAYLGAGVPTTRLVHLVLERRPDAVLLSTSIAAHLPELGATIQAVRDATGAAAPFLVAGGRPFLDDPALAKHLGADATALDARSAVACLRARFPHANRA